MAPFYRSGSTALRIQSHFEKTVHIYLQVLGVISTHLINLVKMKGWVDPEAIQWFWTQDPLIRNAAPKR